jgi:hypothetical protein
LKTQESWELQEWRMSEGRKQRKEVKSDVWNKGMQNQRFPKFMCSTKHDQIRIILIFKTKYYYQNKKRKKSIFDHPIIG